MIRLVICICLLAAGLVNGCGYHASGAGDQWVGQGGKTIYVELFVNRTSEPYLDTILTNEVTAQLARSRLVEVVKERSSADMVLSGAIMAFSSSAQAYNPKDDISEYRAQMTATATLMRRADNVALWKGDLSRNEIYSARSEKGLQRAGESLAARVAARRIAEDLMARLLEDF